MISASDQIEFESRFGKSIKEGKRVEAIKYYRILKEVGFKEAFDYIQNNWIQLRRKYCEE